MAVQLLLCGIGVLFAMCAACFYRMGAADAIDSLDAENVKLREELEQWHRLTAGIELPEYPITQFQPKDLERENAKLRKLVQRMWPVFIGEKRATFADRLHVRAEIDELGIEVGKP